MLGMFLILHYIAFACIALLCCVVTMTDVQFVCQVSVLSLLCNHDNL